MIEAFEALMLVSLVIYALTGGADYGGGVWDLLAFGPRKAAQRALIATTLAPIWEANHVWLIFLVVLLFAAFPLAFSVVSIALHVPLTVMLFGIVLRGAAFTFRHYGGDADRQRYGLVFAGASIIAPLCLGLCLGAITAGIAVQDELPVDGFVRPWLRLFPVAVGCLTLVAFSFLAAVYLSNEAREPALQDDFRRRALVSQAVLAALAVAVGFRPAWWVSALALLALGMSVIALLRRWFRIARIFAASEVGLLIVGWALAQHPLLIAPELTFARCAAPEHVLVPLFVAALAGSAFLFPSLYYLMRVFKKVA